MKQSASNPVLVDRYDVPDGPWSSQHERWVQHRLDRLKHVANETRQRLEKQEASKLQSNYMQELLLAQQALAGEHREISQRVNNAETEFRQRATETKEVMSERKQLKEAVRRKDEEIERLQEALGIVKRDAEAHAKSLEEGVEEKLALVKFESAAELEEAMRQLSAAHEEQQAIENRRKEKGLRRLMHLEVARGWHAWADAWRERGRLQRGVAALRNPWLKRGVVRWRMEAAARRRLGRALKRLQAPGLPKAWRTWKVMAERAARLLREQQINELKARLEAGESELIATSASSQEELSNMRARLQRKELEMEEMLEEARASNEMAKMRRQQQCFKRMLILEMWRGWHSWRGLVADNKRMQRLSFAMRNPGLSRALKSWAEEREVRRRLRYNLARMKSPALSHAMRTWRKLAVATARKLREKAEGRTAGLQKRCKELEEKLAHEQEAKEAAAAELAAFRAAIGIERRQFRETIESKEAESAMARQKQAMMRMMHLSLSRGWHAWTGWREERRRLQRAAKFLQNPGLNRCWHAWIDLREERRRLRHAAARMRNLPLANAMRDWRLVAVAAAQKGRRTYLEEIEHALSAAKSENARLETLLQEREAEREASLRELAEKVQIKEAEAAYATELAVQRRQQEVARRMMNLEVARGWHAWRDQWRERKRLIVAARRLQNPGLARGWQSWRVLVGERKRLAAALSKLSNPALTHAFRTLRTHAVMEAKRAADERNKQAEQRFLELQATCEELQRLLAERDAQHMKVRHRLDDALAAGRSFSAGRLPKGTILRRHLSPRAEGEFIQSAPVSPNLRLSPEVVRRPASARSPRRSPRGMRSPWPVEELKLTLPVVEDDD